MSKQTRRTDAALLGAARQATPEDLTSCHADNSVGSGEGYIAAKVSVPCVLFFAAVWPYLKEFSVHDCQ